MSCVVCKWLQITPLSTPLTHSLQPSMEKQLDPIIFGLTSKSYKQIVNAIGSLKSFLSAFVSSAQLLRQTQTVDSRLGNLIALQDSFQYNIASALLQAYEFLSLNLSFDPESLLTANQCMCGLLLIHPNLRKLFERESNMALIILLLNKQTALRNPNVCISSLSLLVHILVNSAPNLRVFEKLGGCKSVSQHIPRFDTDKSDLEELSLKVVEFFIFYLTDEIGLEGKTRSVEEKTELLRPDFPAIDELRRNLEDLSTWTGLRVEDALATLSMS